MSFKKNDIKLRQANGSLRDPLSDTSSNSSVKQQRQKEAMQKLGSIFKKKTEQNRQPDSWQLLIKNLLNSQRGKLPLLLAVEAGNQSMVRELLASQTAEQLKVSILYKFTEQLIPKMNRINKTKRVNTPQININSNNLL